MNILFVTDSYPPNRISGVGQVVKSLHLELKTQNYHSRVLTTGNINNDDADILSYSSNFYVGNFLNTLLLIKIILKDEYDVIHFHHSICTFCLPLFRIFKILRVTSTRIINTLHVDYISEFSFVRPENTNHQAIKPSFKEYVKKYLFYPLHIIIDIVGFYFADQITALSEQNKKEINRHYGFLKKRNIEIVPNGFDQRNFHFAAKNYSSRELSFVYTGSFRTRKNITRTIDILSALDKKTSSKIKLILVGEGSAYYKTKLVQHIESCNFESNVKFVGKIANNEIANVYKEAQFFILTSTYEGFPVSILEAIGSGLIIVTDHHYGAKDMLTNETAIFLSKLDIAKSADNLYSAIQSSKKLLTMQQKAKDHLYQSYLISDITTKYLDIYRRSY